MINIVSFTCKGKSTYSIKYKV